jgi:hypothetical protein
MATERSVQETMELYVLETFPDRLAQSDQRANLVLKGGSLLAVFSARRPTRDVDLYALDLRNDAADVLDRMRRIAATNLDDGLAYETENATATFIRESDKYHGVRVTMRPTLATARLKFHIDVNVGDPVYPEPQELAVPRLLGGSIPVIGYQLALVYGEKISAGLEKVAESTRYRDFVDVANLSSLNPVDGDDVVKSVRTIAERHGYLLTSLTTRLEEYAETHQIKYDRWRSTQQLEDSTPDDFAELVESFIRFADPAVLGTARGKRWSPESKSWI